MTPVPFTTLLSPIRYDFACRGCDYTLRGLAFTADCPECGQGVLRSAAAVAQDVNDLTWGLDSYPQGYALVSPPTEVIDLIARVADANSDALAFVLDAMLFRDMALRPPGRVEREAIPHDATAETFAQALLHFAAVYFGQAAPDVLRKWSLEQSRGIGQVLALLVKAGIIEQEPDDQLEQFDNLYHLST